MYCPECGSEISDDVSLCPRCAAVVEETQPTPAVPSDQGGGEPPDADTPTHWQRIRPILLWGFAFLVVLALSIGGATYAGLHQGEREREQRRQELAEQHYQAGLKRLEDGQYQLAIAEFKYVLKLDPDHPRAQQGIDEAASTQATITARPTATATSPASVAEELYGEAVAKYEAERWEDAADALFQLRQLDPDYESDKVEQMLFESSLNAGVALLQEDRFELGIYYLDRAVALRPLDEEAAAQRRLAKKYMGALDYCGVDWEHCIEHLEELYAIAPDYKDVFQRLYRARVSYADAWYAEGEMCPAEEQYAQALKLINSPEVEEKRAEANEICLVATPTPVPSVEGTEAITLTELPPGFTAGRLAYPVYNTRAGAYDIYALFADGRLVKMVGGADQPSWIWEAGKLGYRDLRAPGVSLLGSAEAVSEQVASGAGLAWPTFSPDGSRVAYAARDAGGKWQIYIAPTDGSSEPTVHAAGRGPAWGPTGLLAWTGCEEDDEKTCGIFVDNLDDDQPPTRLTASISDIGLHWAPGGDALAYMSDHTGNWEIYYLSVTGGVAVLTDDPASDGLPAWAPDGSGIAFVSNRDGTWGLYVMRPAGEDPQKILTLGPSLPNWTAQRLSWAP